MRATKIIDISQHRQFSKKPIRKRKRRQKGSIRVRGSKLWFSFYYYGKKVREPSGLTDTPQNKKLLRKRMDLIMAEIDNGLFEFSRWFPKSKQRENFAEIEGRSVTVDPNEILFKEYKDKWWQEMSIGWSRNKIRDYTSIFNAHLLPAFGDLPFSEIRPYSIKKFYRQASGSPQAKRGAIVRKADSEHNYTFKGHSLRCNRQV
jgi:hypothetical protein